MMKLQMQIIRNAIVVAAAALFASVAGCNPSVGDRCLPDPQGDECPSGSKCTTPDPACLVFLCCPEKPTASTPAGCLKCLADEDTGAPPSDDAGVGDAEETSDSGGDATAD
jgi:hypothetical protein